MAFEWKNRQNGIDDVLADDINALANEVIRIGKETEDATKLTKEQLNNINSIPHKADDIDLINLAADTEQALEKKADIEYVDEALGDIDTALDNIIAIQNELIGGDSE